MNTLNSLEKRIKKNVSEINKLEKQESSAQKRKKRAKHLIEVGALLEIAGIDNIDRDILLGYFLAFHKVKERNIKILKKMGIAEFKKRKTK